MIPLACILFEIFVEIEPFDHRTILAYAVTIVVVLLLQIRDATLRPDEGEQIAYGQCSRIDKDYGRNTKPHFFTKFRLHDFLIKGSS